MKAADFKYLYDHGRLASLSDIDPEEIDRLHSNVTDYEKLEKVYERYIDKIDDKYEAARNAILDTITEDMPESEVDAIEEKAQRKFDERIPLQDIEYEKLQTADDYFSRLVIAVDYQDINELDPDDPEIVDRHKNPGKYLEQTIKEINANRSGFNPATWIIIAVIVFMLIVIAYNS